MRETQRETGTIETPLRVTLNKIPKESNARVRAHIQRLAYSYGYVAAYTVLT